MLYGYNGFGKWPVKRINDKNIIIGDWSVSLDPLVFAVNGSSTLFYNLGKLHLCYYEAGMNITMYVAYNFDVRSLFKVN